MLRMRLFLALLFLLFQSSIILGVNLPNGITLEKHGNDYHINFSLINYEVDSKNVEGEGFISLSADGYGVLPDYGEPALPIVSFNLMIPNDGSIPEVSLLEVNEITQNLDSKIYPFQKPWEKSKPIADRPFTINREYYKSNGSINRSVVSISEPFIIGGAAGVTVTIKPFAYNPAESKLQIIQNAKIKLSINSSIETSLNQSESFDNYLNSIFVNYNRSSKSKIINYVIITAPEYESELTGFVNNKQNLGYNVSVYNTTTTGTNTTSIKSFLQSLYDNPATKPEFILLVGDTDKIEAWAGSGTSSPTTDLYYALLEGSDYYADSFIGRFSVRNQTELSNALAKSIYMENNISILDKNNVFMASTDNSSISEGTHNFVIDNYFSPDGYDNLKLYTVTYNATTTQLINALNDNKQFAIYSGHGSNTGWADGPALSQPQVRALTNTVYPFVYSFACITGSYHLIECFGETWIRTGNGASTFYGSSVNSYWDEDDVLEKKIFESMFVDDLTQVTPMFDQAKIYFATHFGGNVAPGNDLLRYIEMYNLMGDPAQPTKKLIPPDSTAPTPVADLSVIDQTSNSIKLGWTAPYDSTFGGISSYDIRFSENEILNDNDYQNASAIIYGGNSDTAGTPKSFEVSGLSFSTEYYFAIKAMDVWGNASPISNIVSGTTFEAPEISVNPNSMTCTLLPNTSAADTFVISNISSGSSTLDYSIEFTNHVFPGRVKAKLVPVKSNTDVANEKDKNAETKYGASIKGSGGPDEFGYEWKDSNEPGGPYFIWNDITSTGTEITNWIATGSFNPRDEGYAGPFALGFPFKFYGETKTQLYVSTNGLVTFEPIANNIFSNASIPNSASPNDIIAPFWDDLEGGTQGKIYYQQAGNKFIVQFTNWIKYNSTQPNTFQVVLHSNGKIFIYYNSMQGTVTSSTIGIENANGSVGLQVANNAAYITDGLALQFMAEPEWLLVNEVGGTLYNGNSVSVVLNFSCDDLELGTYSMDCVITSNDPSSASITVPITMIVSDNVPVELTAFNASEVEGEVYLNWETKTELNNSGFSVERKKAKEKNWKSLSFIKGSGTTTEATVYNFSDKPTEPGKYEYRLKQIDFDGTFAYSEILNVNFSAPDKYELSQNYPNPFNPATKIKFSIPKAGMVNLAIYNLLGEKVAELINQELEIGYHEAEFNAANFASGVYLFRISAGDFNSVKKMMLMK
jgi:hypothetical protein